MSINCVIISGNIGHTPELKALQNGSFVLSFSVCVNARIKRGEQWEDKPNWIEVSLFGARAESVAKYLSKGSHVTVAGRLDEQVWQAQDGTNRRKLRVICDNIDFVATKQATTAQPTYAAQSTTVDDDIPF